ncbi:MAG: DUF2889 domain-containing protein [Pseudomonadota bacterium]
MTELPPPTARQPIHTRRTTTHGYLRDDGLWDIEGELIDTKSYPFTNPEGTQRAVGDAVHHMRIRLTVDDTLTVREAVAAMPSTPFGECPAAADPFGLLVGAQCGPGWRKAVDAAMGGVRGCTHLRELLGAMATVAFQTVASYRNFERRAGGEPMSARAEPHHAMGKCLAWDFDGPLVARIAPQFIGHKLAPRGNH